MGPCSYTFPVTTYALVRMPSTQWYMEELEENKFPRRMLKESTAAEVLGVSPKTLRNWRSNGSGGPPYRKLKGAGVRYWLDELLQWADAQT